MQPNTFRPNTAAPDSSSGSVYVVSSVRCGYETVAKVTKLRGSVQEAFGPVVRVCIAAHEALSRIAAQKSIPYSTLALAVAGESSQQENVPISFVVSGIGVSHEAAGFVVAGLSIQQASSGPVSRILATPYEFLCKSTAQLVELPYQTLARLSSNRETPYEALIRVLNVDDKYTDHQQSLGYGNTPYGSNYGDPTDGVLGYGSTPYGQNYGDS